MTDVTLGITLRADGSGLVGQVRIGREEFDKLGKSGSDAANRMTAAMSRFNLSSQVMVAGMSRAGVEATRAAGSFGGLAARNVGRFGMVAQQAGFQIGDMAVQIASGQGAMRAFVQQGSQMLGFFGVWGAVIGAAGAVVGALVLNLDLFGDANEEARRKAGEFAAALDAASTSQERLEVAIAAANQVLMTASELEELAEQSKLDSAVATGKLALETEKLVLARLREQRANQEALELANAAGGTIGLESRLPDLDQRIADQIAEIEKFESLLAELADPTKRRFGAGGDDGVKLIEAETDSLTQLLSAMREEVELLGLSKRARAEELAVRRAQDAAMKEGNLLTESQVHQVRALADAKFELQQAERDAATAAREWQKAIREQGKATDDLRDGMKNAGQAISTAFEDAIIKGESLTDVLQGLGNTIMQIAMRLAVTKPLEGFLGGLLDNLFGNGSPSVGFGLTMSDIFHEGGQVGRGGQRRAVPSLAFAGAPRFGRGGLVGGEVPVIAHQGEVIGWPWQMRQTFGGDVEVNVIDQRRGGERAQVTQRQGPDGKKQIDILIRDSVNAGIRGGEFDGAMAQSFGLRRSGASR